LIALLTGARSSRSSLYFSRAGARRPVEPPPSFVLAKKDRRPFLYLSLTVLHGTIPILRLSTLKLSDILHPSEVGTVFFKRRRSRLLLRRLFPSLVLYRRPALLPPPSSSRPPHSSLPLISPKSCVGSSRMVFPPPLLDYYEVVPKRRLNICCSGVVSCSSFFPSNDPPLMLLCLRNPGLARTLFRLSCYSDSAAYSITYPSPSACAVALARTLLH